MRSEERSVLAILSGALSRTALILTLFSLTMIFLFVIGGYQHLSDDSMQIVLSVEAVCSSINSVLCAILCVLSIIAIIREKERFRYIRMLFATSIALLLSLLLLNLSLAIRMASQGL